MDEPEQIYDRGYLDGLKAACEELRRVAQFEAVPYIASLVQDKLHERTYG